MNQTTAKPDVAAGHAWRAEHMAPSTQNQINAAEK
jgi:hypothetical protein